MNTKPSVKVGGRVCSSAPVLSLPVQSPGQWTLLHTSPILSLLQDQLELALLGELDKINPVSGVRVTSLEVGEDRVEVEMVCGLGETVTLHWLVSPLNYDQDRILSQSCTCHADHLHLTQTISFSSTFPFQASFSCDSDNDVEGTASRPGLSSLALLIFSLYISYFN